MEGEDVWVAEVWRDYGEGQRVLGVYVSREAAWDGLKTIPGMTVYVDADGVLRGRPRSEKRTWREMWSWDASAPQWARGYPVTVQGRAEVTPRAS